jgi:hypothetical protein
MSTKSFPNQGWLLMNGDAGLVTNSAAEKFIDQIQEARKFGFGFVPFLGAGFSAPSGAPLVNELTSYLQRCICMALGAYDDKMEMEPWEPRTDQWPPFIDRNNTEPEIGWRGRVSVALQKVQEKDWKDSMETSVIAEGLGAMSEWRTALLFLSRLKRDPRGTTPGDRARGGRGRQGLSSPSAVCRTVHWKACRRRQVFLETV